MDRAMKRKYLNRAERNLADRPDDWVKQIADAALLAATTRGTCSKGHWRRVLELARAPS